MFGVAKPNLEYQEGLHFWPFGNNNILFLSQTAHAFPSPLPRYCVKLSSVAERLPPHYPISRPALGLIHQLLTLILPRVLPVSALAY